MTFPLLKRKVHGKKLVYLDNAATTQKPQEVIEKITNYYENMNANIHRGIYRLSEEATNAYADAKKTVAQFMNAYPDEIIFTRNATESLNMLAYTLTEITEKKDIVITALEHHANLVPWQEVAKRKNMQLKVIKLKDDLSLDYEDAKKKITKDTAIVAFPHISNAIGTKVEVEKIITLAKEVNAFTILDAAQSIPHEKVDVKALDIDFLAFSAHKSYGPTGIGVLFGKRSLLEQLPPFLTGGDMIEQVTYEKTTWNQAPMKFEAGTPHIAGALGLAAAINFLQKQNRKELQEKEHDLAQLLIEKLKAIKGVMLYTPPTPTTIVSFNVEGFHPHDVAAILDAEGIAVRAGHHCAMPLMEHLGIPGTVRASFALYNTKEEVEALANAVASLGGKHVTHR